ncbi:MAG: glycosyltransferase family 4 protein [Phycisphaerales bacterium]
MHHPPAAPSPPELNGRASSGRPLRLMLLTDTLADVNGVSRFILDVARAAHERARDLTVVTSTRMACPSLPNIVNIPPLLAARMPRYEQLEAVLPPMRRIFDMVILHRPDAVHLSTPGPVGIAGWWAARRLRIPIVGIYHTDFPAYIAHLFDDDALTWTSTAAMRWFYKPFAKVMTRSAQYARVVKDLGIRCSRIRSLRPGTDTQAFHPRHADRSIWRTIPGCDPQSVKVLFVGRVSVEKNLPFTARIWAAVSNQLRRAGPGTPTAELIIVGDGPYRREMEAALQGMNAHFLGFRLGAELSRLYASSDLFLFNSLTDTLGQVVLEAQASGIAVLVSDFGGPQEVTRNGTTGLVLPGNNQQAWVDALVALITDRPRLRSMGLAAREYAQTMSIDASFDHFWEVHEQAVWTEQARRGERTQSRRQAARRRRLEAHACATTGVGGA